MVFLDFTIVPPYLWYIELSKGKQYMTKPNQRHLPIPYTKEVSTNLNRIQAKRQLRDGKKTPLTEIAKEILATAKDIE
jgi:hypothetical protein